MLDEKTQSWWYEQDGQQAGPVTAAAIARLVAEGRLGPEHRVWRDGMGGWAPLGTVAELAPALAGARGPARPPPLGAPPPFAAPHVPAPGPGRPCTACGAPLDVRAELCPRCGVRQPSRSERNRVVAALLAFFLGGFGVHKFYLGRIVWGVVYLLFCWTCVPTVVAFVEGILYLTQSDEAFAAKYG